jgi:hypothetical protein
MAATVGPSQEHETLAWRALVTPARPTLAGQARLHTVVFDRGWWEGGDRWWRPPHGLLCGVPAKAHLALTVEAHAQAAVGEGLTVAGRVQTVRHGQGKTAGTERLETAVGGITGLTTSDPEGTAEPRLPTIAGPFNPTPSTPWSAARGMGGMMAQGATRSS